MRSTGVLRERLTAPPKPKEAPERKPRRKAEPSAELEEALAYMRSLGLRV